MFGPRIITGAACALALGASTAQAGTATINYTSSTKFRVPPGVTKLQVLAIGGAGGSVVVPDSSANHADVKVLGGLGAQAAATVTVVPTTQLSIDVNTGAGLAGQFLTPAGNGGGLSAVRDDNGYIVVAAGGGGAGGSQPYPYASTSVLPGAGGNAGSTAGAGSTGGQFGSGGFGEGGKAGTISAGGAAGDTRGGTPATAGTKGQGGSGSGLTSSADATPIVVSAIAAGGGGGAGYFGGGGGGGSNAVYNPSSGGGYASAGGGGAGRSYVSDTGNATGGVISMADRLAQPVVRLTFNDSTPPTVQLAGATSNATQFAGQAGVDGGDAASVTVEFFAGATATGTPAVTATAAVDPTTGGFTLPTPVLTDGTWTARVKQIDAAGNVGFSLAQTFTVDATPPTIDFSGVRPTYGVGEIAAAGITCKDASSGVTACSAPVLVDTAVAGPHTISVTATDAAGNTVTQSASYTVIAPAPAPTPTPLPAIKKADAKFKITKTTVTRSGKSLAIKLSGSVVRGATGTVSVGKAAAKVGKKGTWSLSTKVKGGASGVKITVNYSGDATYAALAVTKTAKPASAKKK